MKQFFLTALVCITAIAGTAQQKTDLEGVWKLDSVELYRHSGKDSVKVSNELLPENNAVSGVFDTLSFAGDKCKSRVSRMDVESVFSVSSNTLNLYFTAAGYVYFFTYTLTGNKPQIELLYKYYYPDRENPTEVILYSVKLKYYKLNIDNNEK